MNIFHSIAIGFMSLIISITSALGLSQPAVTAGSSIETTATTSSVVQTRDSAKESISGITPQNQNAVITQPTQSTPSDVSLTLPTISATPLNVKALPLGDYKYTTTGSKKGYVYVCHIASGGGGAQVDGSWIHAASWDSTSKTAVEGSVSWPNAFVHITVSGNTRTITTNDLPTDHTTGIFPIQASDPAAQIDRNPNSITAQNYSFAIPTIPVFAPSPQCIYGEVGVMTDGVVLNDAFDAEYRDAAAHEVQDSCQGHPNEQGYHYHSLSSCIKNPTASTVIGWAFDGFPITGPILPTGARLSSADLDECHGMTSDVFIDGKSISMYHYVMTDDFPYSVACFKGISHEPHPSGSLTSENISAIQQSSGSSTGLQPPEQAIDACKGKSSDMTCSISTPNGTRAGSCKIPPNTTELACVPQ